MAHLRAETNILLTQGCTKSSGGIPDLTLFKVKFLLTVTGCLLKALLRVIKKRRLCSAALVLKISFCNIILCGL